MISRYRRVVAVLIALSSSAILLATAHAADDAAGAKDHPLLTRYPRSHIVDYQKNYDSAEFLVATSDPAAPEKRRIEGDLTSIRYFYDTPDSQASPLQLIRNYQNALKAIEATVVYERLPREGDGGETTLTVTANGKECWVKVVPEIYSAPTQSYQLVVVELAPMVQVVSANKMWDELTKNGFVTLYINFDTGKADLKADGIQSVNEIVALMTANPTLALSVQGHTDNVGDAASNKTLSENRAMSVVKATVAGGVDTSRLSAAGFGQESPIADNRSEEGRAKNRRVELVKK